MGAVQSIPRFNGIARVDFELEFDEFTLALFFSCNFNVFQPNLLKIIMITVKRMFYACAKLRAFISIALDNITCQS